MFAGILIGFYLLLGVYLPSAAEPIKLAKYERPQKSKGPQSLFEIPLGLKTEVDFWKMIYSEYTSDQALMHDPNNLERTYGVIALPHCDEPPLAECLKSREDVMKAEKERICAGKNRGCIENVRAQVGQRDKFSTAIGRADAIIETIEKIFASSGIPKEISRLPFVESMFNAEAKSHAGAGGIWQLMPRTAKILGIKVSRQLDERSDITKATEAAARHLMRDFKRLGKWDLAINAYNAGPGRIADAINKLGTDDIAKIIKDYYHPAYGFASRNFYPEFLAALQIYENRHIYFSELYAKDGNVEGKINENK